MANLEKCIHLGNDLNQDYQIGEIQKDGTMKITPFYYDVKSRILQNMKSVRIANFCQFVWEDVQWN